MGPIGDLRKSALVNRVVQKGRNAMKRNEQATKQEGRKLTLSKETIRRLTEEDLTQIAGGYGYYTDVCGTSGNPRCTCPV